MTAETYLYVQTVANRMKVSARTVYRLIQDGKLSAIQVRGRSLRIPESAFNAFINGQEVDPDEDCRGGS